MRIKIIGENNCARATRHLLRLAGFAVTEFLPVDAVTSGPQAGYAITIELAPAPMTPDACLRPDLPTQERSASRPEEADCLKQDASSPAFAEATTAGLPAFPGGAVSGGNALGDGYRSEDDGVRNGLASSDLGCAAETHRLKPVPFGGGIHFDSVESALEAAVLRHVTQLAAAPVIVDRPGGVVHSDRELRIVAPVSGDARADEAAAVAIEFGVLRGLLDLMAPGAGKFAAASGELKEIERKRKWWPFGIFLMATGMGILGAGFSAAPARVVSASRTAGTEKSLAGGDAARAGFYLAGIAAGANAHRLKPVPLVAVTKGNRLKPVLLAPQGQMASGVAGDPCGGQGKLIASINLIANTQLVSGTASKKIYVCSIHVVTAAAADIAVVEGTGTVCGTGTAGVGGFGGGTAATGWNFAANGGIVLGNGGAAVGAEGTSGDNLCIFSSGSGQVSGGIGYVVE